MTCRIIPRSPRYRTRHFGCSSRRSAIRAAISRTVEFPTCTFADIARRRRNSPTEAFGLSTPRTLVGIFTIGPITTRRASGSGIGANSTGSGSGVGARTATRRRRPDVTHSVTRYETRDSRAYVWHPYPYPKNLGRAYAQKCPSLPILRRSVVLSLSRWRVRYARESGHRS